MSLDEHKFLSVSQRQCDSLSTRTHHEQALQAMASASSSTYALWDRARSFIYDRAIVNFTSTWYRAVLDRIPSESHILDVGVGTGTALLANASLLRSKRITVVGVDYDSSYVQQCRKNIHNANMDDYISVVHADINQFTPEDNRLFDFVYFSGSFMILPNQVTILKRVVELLVDREKGRVFFTQTFELQKNSVMEWIKPKLMALTTIDFGNVSYEGDFDDTLHEAGVVIHETVVLDDGKKVDGVRESRLISARSRLYVPIETESPI